MLGKSRNKLLFYCAAFDVKERRIVVDHLLDYSGLAIIDSA